MAKTDYSIDELNDIARTNPAEFLELLSSNKLVPACLTFAAEIAGHIRTDYRTQAACILEKLTRDPYPLVREGAVIGLSHLTDQKGVRELLQLIANTDESEFVRNTAIDVL